MVFSWLKRQKTAEDTPSTAEADSVVVSAPVPDESLAVSQPQKSPAPSEIIPEPDPVVSPPPVDTQASTTSLFGRLKQSLTKTRHQLSEGINRLFLGKKAIDDELLEELEAVLLQSDLGMAVSQKVLDNVTEALSRKALKDSEALKEAVSDSLLSIIAPCEAPLTLPAQSEPFVILVTGVNGSGKTTTIGKLAARFKAEGRSVMLAAGDTFRAAAVEQLQTWGARLNVPVIAQGSGADSASVIFDAYQSARAKGIDVLIADTAGRLHTQDNLMRELEKISRVLKKLDERAPHETCLVLDGTIGQNALSQAREFNRTVPLDSLIITKLDGTAKGGALFALAEEMKCPIRFIGVGERAEDLQPFTANAFVDALFDA